MPSRFGFLDPVHHHPEEAAAIRRAAAELLDSRSTLAKIAADWTALGLQRRRAPGKPWDAALVYQALTQDRVGGIVRRNGVVVDEAPTWLPILTRTQADGLRTALRYRDVRTRTSFTGTHLARGIARCRCGREMVHAGFGNRRKYVCRARMVSDYVYDGEVHSVIADHLLDGALRDAALGLLIAHGTDLVSYVPRSVSEVTKELGQMRRRVEQFAKSADEDAAVQAREAETRISLLESERDDRQLWEALTGLNDGNSTTLAESWDASPLEARHTILRHILTATVEAGRGRQRVRIESLLS